MNVLSFTIGPEIMPLPWASVLNAGTAASGCLASENCGRPMPMKSPCQSFEPDLVTTSTAAPALRPYSAEMEFLSTFISCTAENGMAANMVCRPQLSLAVVLSRS